MNLLEKLNAIPRPSFIGEFEDVDPDWHALSLSATISAPGMNWRGVHINAWKPGNQKFRDLPRVTPTLGGLLGYGRATDLLAYATWMVEVERVLKEHHECSTP